MLDDVGDLLGVQPEVDRARGPGPSRSPRRSEMKKPAAVRRHDRHPLADADAELVQRGAPGRGPGRPPRRRSACRATARAGRARRRCRSDRRRRARRGRGSPGRSRGTRDARLPRVDASGPPSNLPRPVRPRRRRRTRRRSTERGEEPAHVVHEQVGDLHRREVAAAGLLHPVGHVVARLDPAAWEARDLVGVARDPGRDSTRARAARPGRPGASPSTGGSTTSPCRSPSRA